METGKLKVEKVRGESTLTRSYSKYPYKFITPRKVGSSQVDAIWIYTITYSGVIVSDDSIKCKAMIGDGCMVVLKTKASTKARIESDALLAVFPDPVTYFSIAKYSQKLVFNLMSNSNLLMVDWVTSGRHERGEKWDFVLYKSTNNIFLEDDEPLFLDIILLEQGSSTSIAERMHGYQAIAMVVLLGTRLEFFQNQIQEEVKKLMSEQLHAPSVGSGFHSKSHGNRSSIRKLSFIASCSVSGRKRTGVVICIVAMITKSVYSFLRNQLSGMDSLLGRSPYN